MTVTADGLIYARLPQAVAWATYHAREGAEWFVDINLRAGEARGKDAVDYITACYADGV